MRVLVTGGNGFVGRHLVTALRERGDTTLVAARLHDGAGVDFALDLGDAQNVTDVVNRAQPDLIFHLAAQAAVPASLEDPLATYDVNALGTARLLEAVRQTGKRPRVVLASSGEVYGARERSDYPLRETLAPQPANPYAASKAAAEAIALGAWHSFGIPAIIARAFNHCGPGPDARFAVAGFAAQLAAIAAGGAPLMYVGNLEASRDYLDVRDVIAAYIALAERGIPGEIYNVCSGKPVTLKEMLRAMVTVARLPVEIREDPARLRPSDTPVSYGDPTKLQTATGWQPHFSRERTLRDTYEAARVKTVTPP